MEEQIFARVRTVGLSAHPVTFPTSVWLVRLVLEEALALLASQASNNEFNTAGSAYLVLELEKGSPG